MYRSNSSCQWTQVFIISVKDIYYFNFIFCSIPSLFTGWTVADSIRMSLDTYLTSPTCLNQSTDIFLQPSPFDAVELIVYILKYSIRPVDILVLGPMTNIAAAIIRDRSIVPKIGTLYISG